MFDFSVFLTFDGIVALLTLTILEIVLGVDNIIFISIVSGKLPAEQQPKARNIGLVAALLFRLGLLSGISYIVGLTEPILTVPLDIIGKDPFAFSGRDLILLIGGLFLIYKSTTEIHHKMEQKEEESETGKVARGMAGVIAQIIMLDIIFSFDSILTAVGLTEHIVLMMAAVIISLVVMMAFAGKISDFINRHPTLQILALSFLILIGCMLLMEGLHQHVPKGYIYFAVAFSLIVEVLNIRMRKNNAPVKLNKRITEDNVLETK